MYRQQTHSIFSNASGAAIIIREREAFCAENPKSRSLFQKAAKETRPMPVFLLIFIPCLTFTVQTIAMKSVHARILRQNLLITGILSALIAAGFGVYALFAETHFSPLTFVLGAVFGAGVCDDAGLLLLRDADRPAFLQFLLLLREHAHSRAGGPADLEGAVHLAGGRGDRAVSGSVLPRQRSRRGQGAEDQRKVASVLLYELAVQRRLLAVGQSAPDGDGGGARATRGCWSATAPPRCCRSAVRRTAREAGAVRRFCAGQSRRAAAGAGGGGPRRRQRDGVLPRVAGGQRLPLSHRAGRAADLGFGLFGLFPERKDEPRRLCQGWRWA